MDLTNLKIGTVFTNAQLMEKFGVSNSSGMRRSRKKQCVDFGS
ncbi:hypothetical protein [Moraxella bovis]|nr:hypothetical protein [Moraxella bovis]